ncbi:hypothetical protein GCM10011496_30390 [Polaromonas eurypsychrophila]|uniref:Uncharacterized protein n=1 Tax=Polaromonas eurypsychrophila TaxID=1614635 RepID=A0A916SMH3_9BURK|nr:hypothetical protein GCM10011496_30390 [Polaromonas eurypsychrophila]
MSDSLSQLSNVATAIGVGVAAWQLWLAQKQSVTSFEDSFTKEYRVLASRLPTKALLGEVLSDHEHDESFDEFYHYFDLCNEQVFLWKSKRISEKTWRFWKDGMASHMKRPAFQRAWSEIASRSDGDFSELKSLFPPCSPRQKRS